MTHPKHAAADHEVIALIRERWSPRAFDATRSLSLDELWRLFEAARWAPSSMNEQPWRFVVAHREQSAVAHQKLLSCLRSGNQSWASTAPVLILTAVQLVAEKTGEANRHAYYDAGQAVAYLTLQAQSQGLGIRQMEGFDHAIARDVCQVPDGFEPAVVMAVGYAGSPDALASDKHRAAEVAPRLRRKASDFVFDSTWGTLLTRKNSHEA
ncbi:MAG TPA: nitroreductase family protein [Vicinamibacterales bacterium]|nr:nitroreductase family protein [Vicinamibacterales bacterium]